MKFRYNTLILRLYIEDPESLVPAGRVVFGSIQQAGLEEVHYFNSLEQFEEVLRQQIARLTAAT